MLEWTIIGGGIQGCTLANYLLKTGRINRCNLAIIDPNTEPLATWKRCTKEIEMPYLRSPSIHHLDIDPFALEKFAKGKFGKQSKHFYGPYNRPSLEIFNTHCDMLFEEIKLKDSWITGKVEKVERFKQRWRIFLTDGKMIESKNVVLAIGLSDHPHLPIWASDLQQEGADINHIYDQPKKRPIGHQEKLLIVGGGISAIHTALKWSKQKPGKVQLLTRHSIRTHPFDSDPGCLGRNI
ncbi:hypothetical protein JCM9140_583 [Halalkalibacter wakoensis JCM 9140]|uniref:FAD-dependent urate hydroxylase HpyO/Asp monooxygenase CreE-like FAD/NAD(P)-binding domain-containing protein n=1 Tax=Halalkalibacter wakoensis JCM 9140 TaxID=1236970 RepID=W4PY78_9BACI|nr:FAD/NAD(P)-binding protein [Halalkalibacter wakoensis]GAE24640.1 hypothetical protein JCM9140_583 [Halalkalibacter wakoensis JCM 9140]